MGSIATLVNDGNVVYDPVIRTKHPDQGKASAQNDERPSAVLHRSLHHSPLQAVSAKGNYLFLSNGQKIFDATGGAAVACLGGGNDRLVFLTKFDRPLLTSEQRFESLG